jgi:hypothetical protein
MQTVKRTTKRQMKANRSSPKTIALYMVLAALLQFASTSAVLAKCDTCPSSNKDGALVPKEAPIEVETAPDFRKPLQSGAQGTLLQTGAQGTLLQTGTQGTLLQTGTEGTLLQTGAQGTVLQTGVERQAPLMNILILVDCSHSMKEGLGGMLSMGAEQKMDAAKRVLQETMAMIPSDVNVGLRVFGNSYHPEAPELDCQQSALLVPIGVRNRRAIMEAVRQIRPYGLTPLTYGLHEAAQDLQQFQGKKQIILISDGAETCGSDPCEFIRQLTSRGFEIKVDIVGLALGNDRDAKIQLNCIAKSSGGQFYDSNTGAELVDNIRKIVGEAKVSGKVLTKMKDPSVLTKPNQPPPADFR